MNFEEFQGLLQALQLMSPRQKRAFFQLVTPAQMRVLEEACFNLVKNPKLKSKELKSLAKKYGGSIKVIAQTNPSSKKKALLQKGGFLGALLPVLATVISSLIANSK